MTPLIMSRAVPSMRPSRWASSTTSRSSSCGRSTDASSPPRPTAARPSAAARLPRNRTTGPNMPTTGRHSRHVATTIHGPANIVNSIGTTTSTSQTIAIQPATAETSNASMPPEAANRPRAASSVATTAAITTTDAATKAIVSLAATISSQWDGTPARRQRSWMRCRWAPRTLRACTAARLASRSSMNADSIPSDSAAFMGGCLRPSFAAEPAAHRPSSRPARGPASGGARRLCGRCSR